MFRTGVNVGVDVPADALRRDFDAIVLCWRRRQRRAICRCPAASSQGIHFAMDYLTQQNRRCEGDAVPDEQLITAEGKHVVIIGGGDTGADCLGHRAPPGRALGSPARAAAEAARRARGRQPVAAVAEHLPHLVGARRRRRAALRGLDASGSRTTSRAACAALQARRGRDGAATNGRMHVRARAGHASSS